MAGGEGIEPGVLIVQPQAFAHHRPPWVAGRPGCGQPPLSMIRRRVAIPLELTNQVNGNVVLLPWLA